ncbi:hypothetical protein SELMODRAFT_176005 [Selaginella moellendorffii]|nr:hypothetical protein SELMODRAFT_176005 [Selaginella moellendorffii]
MAGSGAIALGRNRFPLQRTLQRTRRRGSLIAKCESGATEDKPAFGYTRKDVLLIGIGITIFGFGLKSGLELIGLDSLKAGNVVQLVMVLGLTVGWILSYVLRVSNKDMTYAKQLKDYELKVMEKRYQELPEAELEALLAQVEEEKKSSRSNENTTT